MDKIIECLNISVKGIVQGVGFRPFVYNLAKEMGLRGYVTNTSEGVFIAVEGDNLGMFTERLRTDAPPLSKIMSVELSPGEFCCYTDFTIRESRDRGSFTLISQDISVCPECIGEMFDRNDRRYLYPFINCTNCGPRYTITRSVPYDRANTTMSSFRMCTNCLAEYNSTDNRRFHAQPNACPVCGPEVSLKFHNSDFSEGQEANPVAGAVRLLKNGAILAIKGLGGFHLACDADNPDALDRLREGKRRSNKPFAMMAPEVNNIRNFCMVSDQEEVLLVSSKRPIVLLEKIKGLALPGAVAPGNRYLGFMLPYTPLHYLLFYYPPADTQNPNFSALVMTSGNLSEEPIVIDNDEAIEKLSGIADAFLLHNRGIFMRTDDSVIRESRLDTTQMWAGSYLRDKSRIAYIRRSRGYVPQPIPLDGEGPDVLGCGADLKNTFTITKGQYAIPSQHIGDMENYDTVRFFEETLGNLSSVYRAEPVAIVHDLHPGYLSTRWAVDAWEESKKEGKDISIMAVQHHYAHIASVMAEKGLREKVIGVSFDGNGYGDDGTLWGSEFLIADLRGYRRAGHFRYVPLPGGEMAMKEPWRTAVSYLKEAAGDDVWAYLQESGMARRYDRDILEKILRVSAVREFSPLSDAAGRLFDSVSALIGLCDRNTFEGEAAMALESSLLEGIDDDYPIDVSFGDVMVTDFCHAFLGIIDDIGRGAGIPAISARFHNTVASAIIRVAVKLAQVNNIGKVILSGGVFQNLYLLRRVSSALKESGLQVFVNEMVPCNDAGISLGQAYIARERIRSGMHGKKPD